MRQEHESLKMIYRHEAGGNLLSEGERDTLTQALTEGRRNINHKKLLISEHDPDGSSVRSGAAPY